MKRESGVTLIVLVITIIVMLILMGITIAQVVGQNGIIGRVNSVKNNETKAEEEVRNTVLEVESQQSYNDDGFKFINDTEWPQIIGVKYTKTKGSISIKLVVEETLSGIKTIEYSNDGGITYYQDPINPIARSYKFSNLNPGEDYNICIKVTDESGNFFVEQSLIRTSRDIKIGDYVGYSADTATETYTIEKEYTGANSNQTISQESLKWRILNINYDNNTVDLLADIGSTASRLTLFGVPGYNNGVNIMNEICETLYGNTSKGITARSINLDDTEKYMTDAGKSERAAYQNYSSSLYNTEKTYPGIYKYPSLFAQEYGGNVDSTGLNPTGLQRSDKTSTLSTESTQLQTTTSITSIAQYYDIEFNETNFGEQTEVLSTKNGGLIYWVASRYHDCKETYNILAFGLRCGNDRNIGYWMCQAIYPPPYESNKCTFYIRPIITVKLEDISINEGTGTATDPFAYN